MLGVAFGTRPEWLKIKPVLYELKRRELDFGIIFTGQHKDLIDEAEVAKVGAKIFHRTNISETCKNRLNSVVSSLLANDSIFQNISKIMVQGDTSTAFACALAGFHRQIPVIHLEAGLRTHDLEQPFPEEANRQMISCIASLHLCPTKLAKDHLIAENKHLQSHDIVVTGNTSLDNIKDVKITTEKRVLVTMHRRENHESLDRWFRNLDILAEQYSNYEFLFPLHPNPNVAKYRDNMKYVRVVDPMSHQELIQYLASCEYVITDSGGIQEEASFLRKPCMVCRRETERTEGLDNFSLLCVLPEHISDAFSELSSLPVNGDCPYGDGNAAEKVVDAICEAYTIL